MPISIICTHTLLHLESKTPQHRYTLTFFSCIPTREMASTSPLFASSIPLFTTAVRRKHASLITKTLAKGREIHDHNSFGGRNLVDENMVVLRMRIRKMEMVERDDEPPLGWMDWERDIYPSYDMIICDAMRFLQSYLMATRPSFALGMIGLVALSVPISTAVVVLNLVELSRGLLSALHLN